MSARTHFRLWEYRKIDDALLQLALNFPIGDKKAANIDTITKTSDSKCSRIFFIDCMSMNDKIISCLYTQMTICLTIKEIQQHAINKQNTERTVKKGQSRETGNIEHMVHKMKKNTTQNMSKQTQIT